jgi:tRNA (guanine6-N2)-methyltransferase
MEKNNSFVLTSKGIEKEAAQEIQEILGKTASPKIHESIITFSANDKELCLLAYKGLTCNKVGSLLGTTTFSRLEELSKLAKTFDYSFLKDKTFMVRCIRDGTHDFTSKDIEEEVGKAIFEKTQAKVDFKQPQLSILVMVVNNAVYFGIDFTGVDASKRQYRIFTQQHSIKATIAQAMLYMAGYTRKTTDKKVLLDPFCGGGTISIEAALRATQFPVHYFTKDKLQFQQFVEGVDFEQFFAGVDKKADLKKKVNIIGYDLQLKYVSAAKKNAKIAGVEKSIAFGRVSIDWLDTKQDKETIDLIVTFPPPTTKMNSSKVEKVHKEFFNQAAFVLKKKGKLVLACNQHDLNSFKEFAAKEKFNLVEEREVMQGKQEMNILILEKANA